MSSTEPAPRAGADHVGARDGDRARTHQVAPDPSASSAPPAGPSTVAIRAQLLATEHWSLLATRSTTWSEVMSRITIHLTVSSAALVVLALVAQSGGFGTSFRVLSIGLTSAVLVLGTLTGLRVMNASNDDAALVIGMNRLRAAYVEMDAGIAQYLTTSHHDDAVGLSRTYALGIPRSTLSHVLASTAMFVNVVNAIVAGTLAALVAAALGAPVAGVVLAGAGGGTAYMLVMLEIGRRMFAVLPIPSRFPTGPTG